MRSVIVVSSWWSNCLAITCLHRLMAFVHARDIYVIQAGKSDEQMARFRLLMPEGVTELPYPAHIALDDSAMREYLAQEALKDQEGAWFIDHDAFLLSPADSFFDLVDLRLSNSNVCLSTRSPRQGMGITQPAYWLSPLRWPKGLSSFAPIPFQPRPNTRRPDLHQHDQNLALPGKDTLVQVREELAAMNKVADFAIENADARDGFLPPFPPHIHLGGLHLYTGTTKIHADTPPSFWDWRNHTLRTFDAFFRNCPQEWLGIEEPELLCRHQEMMQNLEEGS
jgi:hypothetical protein